MRQRALLAFLAPAVLMFAACASPTLEVKKMPGADLLPIKTVFVQRLAEDERGIDQLIVNQLTRMGFAATNSVIDPPSDAIVTYQDRWMWDITMFMVQLSIQVRDGQTKMVLANGRSWRPSLERKSPEEMVEEVLMAIFKGEKK
jgi:hypothetical protein